MSVSIGENRWRMLRRFLKCRKGQASFREVRVYCRYDKAVQNFVDLVNIGCLEVVKPHLSLRDPGVWRITEFGREVADLGEVELDTYRKLNSKGRKPHLMSSDSKSRRLV